MKYLKKNTIKALFLFARSSGDSVRHDETLPGVLFDTPHQGSPYLEFLEGLSLGEKAELTALYLLGSERLRSLAEWERNVLELMENMSEDLERASAHKIPQIIRHGLEKLARFKKLAKVSPQVVQPSDQPNAQLLQTLGAFTLEAYLEKYGELDGLKRVLTLLDVKGYLNDPQLRRELGIPPLASRMPLETLHVEKKPKG